MFDIIILAVCALVALFFVVKRRFDSAVLALCVGALGYVTLHSITDDQDIDVQMENDAVAVQTRLIQIRVAEEEFKQQHDTLIDYMDEVKNEMKTARLSRYSYDMDELIYFLNNTKGVPQVMKIGDLTEAQYEEGWTEASAAEDIWQIRQQYSDPAAAEAAITAKWGEFRRDTTEWTPIRQALKDKEGNPYFSEDFDFELLRKVPSQYGQSAEFTYDQRMIEHQGIPMSWAMECYTPYESYYNTKDSRVKNKMKLKKDIDNERGDYCGLKIGDIYSWNNNAGNWE